MVLNPEGVDTLPNIPGPIDNLGTVLDSQSNYLIPALTQMTSLLQNSMTEIRLLSPNFTLENFRLIRLLYDSLITN
jgi:lipopolysaccharide biosynthesis glycosyltransferase